MGKSEKGPDLAEIYKYINRPYCLNVREGNEAPRAMPSFLVYTIQRWLSLTGFSHNQLNLITVI